AGSFDSVSNISRNEPYARSFGMSYDGAEALDFAGSDERAPATSTARLSSTAAVTCTRPINAPCPPPTSPMRSLRLSGPLVVSMLLFLGSEAVVLDLGRQHIGRTDEFPNSNNQIP